MFFSGSIVALASPMKETGELDFEQLDRLIEFHIEQGSTGLVAVGTTGESSTLAVDEHLQIIERMVATVKGRIHVIAGTGANSTREALELTKQAHGLGVDACLLVVPYYNKPGQQGLYEHFKKIAESVPIAQILYNVPGRTVADLDNDVVVRLARIENIVGLKDATGDLQRVSDLRDEVDSSFALLSGDDASSLEFLKRGGDGVITVTGNVAPAKMQKICAAVSQGDYDMAEKIDQELAALHKNLFIESNPIPVKYALSKMGFGANRLRLPLTSLANDNMAVVDAAMLAAGINTSK